jgi:hypothetical protein
MQRWHREIHITLREWKKHHKSHVEWNRYRNRVGVSPFVVECRCDDQLGRFRKKDAVDCGNSHCLTCHSYKFPKRQRTLKETLSELEMKEQLKELAKEA